MTELTHTGPGHDTIHMTSMCRSYGMWFGAAPSHGPAGYDTCSLALFFAGGV
jgi:hypothetical protein